MNSIISQVARFYVVALALTACAAAPGCKSNGDSELLERELRCQEDRIYQLEDELDELGYSLESARRENQSLKKELVGGDKGAGGQFAPSGAPPSISVPDVPDVEAPTLESPRIEFVPKGSGGSRLKRTSPAAEELDEAPRFVPQSTDSSMQERAPARALLPASSRTSVLSGDSRKIMRLALNRQLTGGWNPDGHHGDEGVCVAFGPRDAQNKLVEAAGEVSIVVLDPSQTGVAARVARWDFATDEAESHFHKGPLGKGMQFELPWPSNPPVSRDLRLFIRLSTIDGRNVESDARIRVTPNEKWATKPLEEDVETEPADDDAVDEILGEEEEDEPVETEIVRSGDDADDDNLVSDDDEEGPALLPTPARKEPVRTARPKWSPNR